MIDARLPCETLFSVIDSLFLIHILHHPNRGRL